MFGRILSLDGRGPVCVFRSRRIPLFLVVITLLLGFAIQVRAQDGSVDRCLGVVCPRIDDCHTIGACDPDTGHCSTPTAPDGAPCDDSNTATLNDQCVSGECRGTVNLCFAVDCPAFDDCHERGTCDPATGRCSNPLRPDGTPCEDYNSATVNDRCTTGVCAGTFNLCFAVNCTANDDCHEVGVCDPRTGECTRPVKPDGTPCEDYNRMTEHDVCLNGVCAGTFNLCQGVVCRTAPVCHSNDCELSTGDCILSLLPDGTPCDDGDPGTSTDACEAGACVGSDDLCLGVVCDAVDACHEAACDPTSGRCVSALAPDDTPCVDGRVGTAPDLCVRGSCVGESLYEFSGFLPPLADPPNENLARAGSVVVVKFSLNGDFGLDILEPGFPRSAEYPCGTRPDLRNGVTTSSTGGSGLTYDAVTDQYLYHWRTDSTWNGICRQLILQLNDGAFHQANIRFRNERNGSQRAAPQR